MDGKVGVLVDARLYNELILRARKRDDVSHYVEHALETFLERTEGDGDIWSAAYVHEWTERTSDSWERRFGKREQGYQWQMLFLPNGTRLRMTYQGQDHHITVSHQQIRDENRRYSPSEWASAVANNTNRNAWRDIWVCFPGDAEWQLAASLRSELFKSAGSGAIR